MTVLPIGVNFFVTAYTIDVVTLARAIEDAGYDSFWVPDHTVVPVGSGEYQRSGGKPPEVYGQFADPLVTLAYAGCATTRIKLATGICLVAQRHALTLAKTVSTLDRFSAGRLMLGVGAGWSARELELFGVDFKDRWPVVEETVEAMRVLWRDGRGEFAGQHVRFPEVLCDPLPVSRPGPPVLIGAPPTPAMVRRAARWADGWVAVFATPEEVRDARRAISGECEALARDPASFEISAFVMDVSPATQERYAEAGADRLVLQLYNHPGTSLAIEDWEAHHVSAGSRPPPRPADTLRALELAARSAGL